MTVETIEKDGVTVRILYGFGRIQRARYILYANLPDSLKRIQTAGGEVEPSDLDNVKPEDILDYNAKVFPQIAKLVLQSASDQGNMTVDEYVDNAMSESVGNEIVSRVKTVISVLADSKKT
jgi:hypothetical protein